MVEALIDAAKAHGPNWLATEDPVSGQLTYKKLLIGVSVLGRKLMPLAAEGRALGVMLPTSNGAVVTMLAVLVGGPRAGDDQFQRRRGQYSRRLPRRRSRHHPDLAHLRREGPAGHVVEQLEKQVRLVYLEDIRATIGRLDKLRGLFELAKAAGRAQARRLGGDPVHVGHRRPAQGRRAVSPQHDRERRADRGPHRFRPRGQAVQRAAGVPFVRLHRRRHPAADFRRSDLSLSLAAALPHRAGTDLRLVRDGDVRHRYVPQRLCAHGQSLRFPFLALCAGRRRAGEGSDAAASIWKSSACAFSKATA